MLIHGLTGSPSELRFLAEQLHQAGYAVKVPLLPGHGTTSILNLNRTTWHDWLGVVTHGLYILAEDDKRVYVAGLSLGEMLTLSLLALHGNLIRAETVLSTPMKFKGCKSSALLPIVAQYPITWFIKDVPKQTSMDVKEPQGPRHICYDRDSIPAAYSAFELMAIIRERSFLAKIEKPLLIMQSKLDPVIHPSRPSISSGVFLLPPRSSSCSRTATIPSRWTRSDKP